MSPSVIPRPKSKRKSAFSLRFSPSVMLAVSIETQKNLFGKRCECLFQWVGGGTGWGGTKGVGGGGCPDTWRAAFSSSSHLVWFHPIWRPYKILTTFRGLWQLRCPWVCRFCWWRKEIQSRVAVWNLRKGKKREKKRKTARGRRGKVAGLFMQPRLAKV